MRSLKAQAAVAEHPELQGNVAFFGTHAFWRPQEQSPSGQGYHWNTNAETYYLIGDAMGKAMLGMTVVLVSDTVASLRSTTAIRVWPATRVG